jgi:hypothetical protein
MSADLATINSTLLSIKRDTAITAKRLSGKGTSAEEAREGLKQREIKRDSIAKPTAPKAATRKSGGGGVGGFFSGLLAKGIDWLKWFAAIGLGAFFFDEIKKFITAAFKPFKNAVLTWWDGKKADIGKAWEGVLDATGFNALMKGSDKLWNDNVLPFFQWFHPDNNKFTSWFVGAGETLDKWLSDSFLGDEWKSMKNFLLGEEIHGEFGEVGRQGGLLSGAKTYAENIKISLGKFGASLGLIDEEGNITGVGVLAGAGGLATLFTFLGPGKLLKALAYLPFWGVKTLGGLLYNIVGGLGKLVLWTGPKMLGKAALWIGEKGLKGGLGLLTKGFTALSNLVGVKGAFGTALNAAATKLIDWKDGFGKGGMKKGLKAAFTKGSPLLTGLTSMLPALIAALAVAGIVALVIVGLKEWGEKQRQIQAKKDAALPGAKGAGSSIDTSTAVTTKATTSRLNQIAPDVISKTDKTMDDMTTAINRAELNNQITAETAAAARATLEHDKQVQGGTGKRLFFNMQSEVLRRAGQLIKAGVIYHKDGQRAATLQMNKVLEWAKSQGNDPKPVTKAVLAKFGLLFAKAGEQKGSTLMLSRHQGQMDLRKAIADGTFDFSKAMESEGGLTGLFQSAQGLGQHENLMRNVETTRGEDIADGSSQADRGKQAINQATLTQVIKQVRINSDKADLIAQQARTAMTHPGRPGGEANPGNVSVVDRSVNVSNATEFDYQFPAAREIRRFWME